MRNKFEHFEINISLNECQDVVAAALDEIIKFWEIHFKPVSTVEQQENFKRIKSITTEFEVYRKQRLNKFQKIITGIVESKNGLIVLCPDCSSSSFAIFKDDERECNCFVCDEKYKKDDYLNQIRNKEKEYSFIGCEPYDTTCSCCEKETRIRYKISDKITSYCCLNCLHQEEESIIELSPEFEEFLDNIKYAETIEEAIEIIGKGYPAEEMYQITQLFQSTKLLTTKLEKT